MVSTISHSNPSPLLAPSYYSPTVGMSDGYTSKSQTYAVPHASTLAGPSMSGGPAAVLKHHQGTALHNEMHNSSEIGLVKGRNGFSNGFPPLPYGSNHPSSSDQNRHQHQNQIQIHNPMFASTLSTPGVLDFSCPLALATDAYYITQTNSNTRHRNNVMPSLENLHTFNMLDLTLVLFLVSHIADGSVTDDSNGSYGLS